jgi:hypothetical protein
MALLALPPADRPKSLPAARLENFRVVPLAALLAAFLAGLPKTLLLVLPTFLLEVLLEIRQVALETFVPCAYEQGLWTQNSQDGPATAKDDQMFRN